MIIISAIFLTSVVFAESFNRSLLITCDPQIEDCQSESLETIAAEVNEHQQTDVHIDIKVPLLHLNASVKFESLTSLIINGNSTTITCMENNTGIQLSHIGDSIKLSNLIFNSCGTEILRHKNLVFISALIILNCSNVELTEIVIEKSNGIGLMILNHTGGTVNISSALIAGNALPQRYWNGTNNRVFGGGGVYIKFSSGPIYPTTILFDKCTFENNTSSNSRYKLSYTDVEESAQDNKGKGGGVYMSFDDGSVDIHVSFVSCNFTFNQAFIGGALSAQMYRKNFLNISNITVKVTDSLFRQNGCMPSKYTVFGGGMYLRIESGNGAGITNSHFILRNVTFLGNCAELGGGVYYYSHHDKQHPDYSHNSMLLENSTFEKNKAHAGSALVMVPDIFLKKYRGYTIVPEFRNCRFLNNSVIAKKNWTQWNQTVPGVGTVYVSLSDINFQGYNLFQNNWGTALYAVNGVMDFQNSSVDFINNTGLQGGAVALIGVAKIMVGSNNNYGFFNNHAQFLGGALYVSLTDITEFASKSCFIQYADKDTANISILRDTNITFVGNKAKDGTSGHAIYATSLFPCQTIRYGTNNHFDYLTVNISEIFNKRGIKFDNDTRLQPQLATDGATLSFNKSTPLMIIPGEYYEHDILTTDDLGQRTKPSFRVAIIDKVNDSGVQLDSAFSTFIGDELQLTGEPGENATLHLEVLSPRHSYLKLAITLLECPPGFKSNNDLKCVCNAHNYIGLLRCNEDGFYSYLLPGFWTGFIDSKLVTSVCTFCSTVPSRSEISLPRNSVELNQVLCGETRTGIACGKCTSNYTVHFHSPGFLCRPAEPVGCKLGWLFYILSELIPVTVTFIVVLGFNLSFTSGAVNGFILYSQLIDSLDIRASGIIPIPISGIGKVALVLYGFFNLDLLGIGLFPFCLWKGASALDMIAIKYVTIIYAILLIIAVIWIMNRCGGRYLGKYCRITTVRASVIHGISSFLVISYAQCVKVSLRLVLRLYIHPENGSGFKVHPRVWYNGEIEYFSKEHLPYALPALFCLLTIGALPPILLLVYPLLNKLLDYLGLEDKKCVKLICAILPIASLKPLLDSFQGCFKDRLRFFAGLYFLYRWSFLLVSSNTELYSIHYTSIGGVLVFILTLHTICQPYVKRAHNIIDTLLFSNLILINSLLFFNYHNSQNQTSQYKAILDSAAAVQLVLICLPMMVMCMYLLIILCKQVFKHACGSKNQNIITSKARELVQVISARKEQSDSNIDIAHDRIVDEDFEYRGTYKCL